jgi:hypothetical protein
METSATIIDEELIVMNGLSFAIRLNLIAPMQNVSYSNDRKNKTITFFAFVPEQTPTGQSRHNNPGIEEPSTTNQTAASPVYPPR